MVLTFIESGFVLSGFLFGLRPGLTVQNTQILDWPRTWLFVPLVWEGTWP